MKMTRCRRGGREQGVKRRKREMGRGERGGGGGRKTRRR